MNAVEQFLALMTAAMVIAAIAKRFDLPYPLALVIGGLGLSGLWRAFTSELGLGGAAGF